ncbi:hypothetical protein D9611_014991, partial [Ephemerocybe angulata]
MTALPWEPTSLKAHLRYTTQRLGQLQGKLDNVGNITRKDIATLLQQGNVGLARAKAQKLIQEDAHGDLLEILEMEVALLLEHFNEMDTNLEPTPLLSEAIASIIYAGPHAHCKELDAVRSTLIQRFGPDFARAATTNRENYVPIRVLRILNAPLPSATLLNRYLATVARSYGVNWLPDPERHDIVNVLSEVLNSEISAEVDLDRLRKYCVYEEGGQKWMASFDSVVAWADPELHENLQIKGLQPALPHYSYRWLAPLLTYTIPVPGIFLIWDAIFARLPRERDTNYKLDFLVDVTSAMLISLGQTSSSNLWNDEGLAPELVAREVSADDNTFLDGISLLQAYPLTSIQDAERIVQTANDLNNRREMEKRAAEVAQAQPTFGARLATSMWKGFTNQPDPADDSPPSDSDRDKRDDGNETERPAQASTFNLTSVLGGLRPKPQAPVPAPDATTAAPSQPIGASAAAGFWNYAGKLKDSDTVATLAKVGTNWRAKAATVGSQWGRNSISVSNNGQSSSISQRLSGGSDHRPEFGTGDRRDTFVTDARRDSSPRPYFTSPTFQDTAPGYYSSSSNTSSSITSSPTSPADSHHNDSIVKKTKTLLSIASKSPTTVISKRSPRPLLLNSAAPMTSPAHIRSGSDRLKTPDSSEWAEVVKMKRDYMHRHSQSSHSVSSLSPSDAIKSNRSDWDSDTGSRVVPLNRRSVSPMAPSYRINSRPSSSYTPTKSPMSPPGGNLTRLAPQRTLSPQPGLSDEPQLGDTMKQAPESLMGRSSEVPKENHGEEPGPHKQFIAARTGTLEETSDSSWQPNQISRAPRVRSKKYPQRPANLQIRDSAYPKGRTSIEQKTPSPSRLTVDWPTEDPEVTVTPRASSFEPAKDESTPMRSVSPRLRRTTSRDRQRKASADGLDGPPRKLSSASVRSRKVSAGEDSKRYRRESAAHEGDDEGYDDLL